MSDYYMATSAPRPVNLGGREYRVHKLRPRDVGEMEAWFREVVPSPRAEARRHMDGLPDAVAMHIWDKACEAAADWPPAYDSDEGQRLLLSPEGQARILWICLRRGFPDGQFTLDMARDLSDAAGAEGIYAVLKLAAPGDPDDPLPASPPPTIQAGTAAAAAE